MYERTQMSLKLMVLPTSHHTLGMILVGEMKFLVIHITRRSLRSTLLAKAKL